MAHSRLVHHARWNRRKTRAARARLAARLVLVVLGMSVSAALWSDPAIAARLREGLDRVAHLFDGGAGHGAAPPAPALQARASAAPDERSPVRPAVAASRHMPVSRVPVHRPGDAALKGGGANGSILSGRVSHVRDGDTIEVAGRPVRLAGLDCAELGTPAGDRAARHMRQQAGGARVTCRLTGEVSHDRAIGRCRLEGGASLDAMMIAARLCAPFRDGRR